MEVRDGTDCCAGRDFRPVCVYHSDGYGVSAQRGRRDRFCWSTGWKGGGLHIFRGPSKAFVVPLFTQSRAIPAQAINVDIEITDQTADVDANGRPAPVKVTVRASAIVSVGESDAMVNTAANKFFSKPPGEQLSTLTDVLSSAGRRAINLLKHDQLFNARPRSACAHRQRPGRAAVTRSRSRSARYAMRWLTQARTTNWP